MSTRREILDKFAQYRDLKISKDELINTKEFTNFGDNEVLLTRDHVINVLEAFIKGKISEKKVIEWVNVVWWSDWFKCDDKDRDCIANIMGRLDTLDDIPYLRKNHLNTAEAQHYIIALKKNEYVPFSP
jgi:hypothetical protein